MPEQHAKNNFFIDSDKLSEAALAKKHRLETDPSSRTDPMAYWPDMEQIDPTVRETVIAAMNDYDPSAYTILDAKRALEHETCTIEDFKALLAPAALPLLEQMAERASREDRKSVV